MDTHGPPSNGLIREAVNEGKTGLASIMLWDPLDDLIHDQARSCSRVDLGDPNDGVGLGLETVGSTFQRVKMLLRRFTHYRTRFFDMNK